VAHIRDFRRRTYFEAVAAELGADFALLESRQDLDQVAYHPRKMVCAPPQDRPGEPIDPQLLQAVEDRLRSDGREGVVRRQPPRPTPACDTEAGDRKEVLNVWIFEWTDPDGLDPARGDSFAIAADLQVQFQGQVAPVYYSVTQQGIQPGEDPEAGRPVLGLGQFAPNATSGTAGLGQGITIAVIDTGIDDDAVTNAPLPNQQFDSPTDVDVLTVPTAPGPEAKLLGPGAGHGTFIAGLINCVAPGAMVQSYKVASPLGIADEEVIADGIRRAVENGAQVINLSLGGYPFVENSAWPTLRAFPVLEAAIAAIPDNIAVVAAAGNCGSNAEFFPAAFPRVVGVAALDDCANRLWEHSNYGGWVKACTRGVNLQGLFVKGEENPAYDPDGMAETWGDPVNFATWTGTSFAAPLVAAQIAILAAEMGLEADTRLAAEHLLNMSKRHHGQKPCGKRILVDLPGQT